MSADRPNTTWRWATAVPAAVKNALVSAGVTAEQYQDDQLRQGKAVLHRVERAVLAAEPAWSLRLRTVELLRFDWEGHGLQSCPPNRIRCD